MLKRARQVLDVVGTAFDIKDIFGLARWAISVAIAVGLFSGLEWQTDIPTGTLVGFSIAGFFATLAVSPLLWRALRSRLPSPAEPTERVTLSAIEMARLGVKDHCGIRWRGRIENGIVKVFPPRCTEDDSPLMYKPSKPPLRFAITTPASLAATTEEVSTSASLLDALLRPPGESPPFTMPIDKEKEEEERLGLRDLKDDDTSDENSGPWCKECGKLRRIPKRLGDCRMEVIKLFEEELVRSC